MGIENTVNLVALKQKHKSSLFAHFKNAVGNLLESKSNIRQLKKLNEKEKLKDKFFAIQTFSDLHDKVKDNVNESPENSSRILLTDPKMKSKYFFK